MYNCDYLIVGAGFAGCILAERIANILSKRVIIVEKRDHIAGNAYDFIDENNIMVHMYGPHLFHTNDEKVFKYLSKFTDWSGYEHRVNASYKNQLYPFPINRITINKYFGINLSNETDVRKYLDNIKINKKIILNSEDVILSQVGYELYEVFFKNYTNKQWNLYPNELHPSVCGRVPLRYNDDDRYFNDKYQYMPKYGYTKMFLEMLRNNNITVILNSEYISLINKINYKHLIYTGPIDSYFNHKFGNLQYRSIRFEFQKQDKEIYQKYPQINFVDKDINYTRIVEYKQITGGNSKSTTISIEYPLINGEPFYPIPTVVNNNIYRLYKSEADKLSNVIFCGRLAEYQYYNMDQVTARSLIMFNKFL